MAAPIRRRVSSALWLSCLAVLAASCGRTEHERDEGQVPVSSAGAGRASEQPPSVAGGGANQAGSLSASSGTGGLDLGPEGAAGLSDPGDVISECTPSDAPGVACSAPRCWGQRCGVRFDLTCKNGIWDSGDSSLAWELVCPVSTDLNNDIRGIDQGACCGELLPRNDVYTEPASCSLCPETTPKEGDACSLPSSCAPAIIDCFYKCCCYGTLTWAQCDGTRWHVATNCSPK